MTSFMPQSYPIFAPGVGLRRLGELDVRLDVLIPETEPAEHRDLAERPPRPGGAGILIEEAEEFLDARRDPRAVVRQEPRVPIGQTVGILPGLPFRRRKRRAQGLDFHGEVDRQPGERADHVHQFLFRQGVVVVEARDLPEMIHGSLLTIVKP
jgi:hypothetical protein